MTTTALVLAAGMGSRMRHELPKAFIPVSQRPMVLFSLEAIESSGVIDRVVLVAPPSVLAEARELVEEWSHSSIAQDVVEGGATRADSVRQALAAVSPEVDVVVCHDAARPFASPELFERAFDALEGADGVVPVIRSRDTVKRLEGRRVAETIPRHTVGLAQTPQVFRAECLRAAHEAARGSDAAEVTDDAMLLESAGFRVTTVDGEPNNFKITSPEDLRRAEAMLASGPLPWIRHGDKPAHPARRPR
jgi:2-C-methyl-D-erythritol 4-phosphate cytidylyltransferase